MLPDVPLPLMQTSAEMLEFARLRELIAGYAGTAPGRAWVLGLVPSCDGEWVAGEQRRVAEVRRLLHEGGFDFHGLIDPGEWLERARIAGAVLEVGELRGLIVLVGRIVAFREWMETRPAEVRDGIGLLMELVRGLDEGGLRGLVRSIEGKIDQDGTIADHASPELARIRRQIERQQRSIEDGLRGMLRRLGSEGSLQEELITVRGERFVLPVKAEWKRRVPGVVHGASSSGQTFFVEPVETIEQNNELQRLLEEEQAEVRRILAAMTRQIAERAEAIAAGAKVLAEVESLFARARFAEDFGCTTAVFNRDGEAKIVLKAARHPLLEKRLREQAIPPFAMEPRRMGHPGVHPLDEAANTAQNIVPLDLELTAETRQLVISGPNTGGKTVALKTVGLLALMAQAGMPVPAEAAELPLFDAVLADIGDAQSIEQNLSTFSAHITRLNSILGMATERSLVLIDELGSATDPEEGAALAAAIAAAFVERRAWCLISTHHTSLKVYAANTAGVVNAAAGFDDATLAPTYRIRVGVPGASAGINIAQRLGLDAGIIASARARLGSQTEEIGRFLDKLHADLAAVNAERVELSERERGVARERQHLEREGRAEQQRKVREIEAKLASLVKHLEFQVREMIGSVEDKAAQQKLSKQAERGVAKLRREFREQFDATVVAHKSGADKDDPHAQPHVVGKVTVGDTVRLRSLGKTAVVARQIDANVFEAMVGAMKMRVRRDDIAEVVAASGVGKSPVAVARSKGIQISRANEGGAIASEINVIGRTVEEATDEVEKFLDQAFMDGLPQVRVVHGSGMGILRKALRAYLAKHPQVIGVSEPPQNQGGAGATVVELRQ